MGLSILYLLLICLAMVIVIVVIIPKITHGIWGAGGKGKPLSDIESGQNYTRLRELLDSVCF